MAVPSDPNAYCTSAQVAALVPNIVNAQSDFTAETVPTLTQVENFIRLISNQINLQFQMAGYTLPFVALTEEDWLDHQTYYLELVCGLGTASLAGGMVHVPAPTLDGKVSTGNNIFQMLYEAELKKIWNGFISGTKFRAQYYVGTPAEKSILEPIGPYLDYMVGKMNPEQNMTLNDYTVLRQRMVDYSRYLYWDVDWDDFHGQYSTKHRYNYDIESV